MSELVGGECCGTLDVNNAPDPVFRASRRCLFDTKIANKSRFYVRLGVALLHFQELDAVCLAAWRRLFDTTIANKSCLVLCAAWRP